jgi:hypothetical protein
MSDSKPLPPEVLEALAEPRESNRDRKGLFKADHNIGPNSEIRSLVIKRALSLHQLSEEEVEFDGKKMPTWKAVFLCARNDALNGLDHDTRKSGRDFIGKYAFEAINRFIERIAKEDPLGESALEGDIHITVTRAVKGVANADG